MLSVIAFAFLLVFAARLVQVQVVDADHLAEQALASRLVTTEVTPERADILDRNGVVLATSVQSYHIWVNQTKVADWKRTEDGVVLAEGPLDAARILAPILGMSEAELGALMVGDKSFQYLAKDVTPETLSLVREQRIAGVEWEDSSQRLYPNGDIAGNVIGFMAEDGEQPEAVGQGGIERAFQDVLTGTPGSTTFERGRFGTIIPTGVQSNEPAVPGDSVRLTIDRDIQYYAEQRLAEQVANTGSRAGTIVVQDTVTGDILALADYGSVDPRAPGDTPADARGSSAVEDVFEPGSTAKTVTLAAALEEGVVEPTSQFVAPYQYTTANNQTFKDSHQHADQQLTVAGILVSSSNTGTIQVGQLLSDEVRYRYLRAFGLGETTGLGLPHESAGILHPWEEWDGRTRYATMYGQGLSVTAVQTAQVYSIIANGGMRIAPSIVLGTESADGTFTARERDEPVRVVSEQTAAEVLAMLEDVTSGGTGTLAAIDGYRVAGKTGTAQAPDGNGGLTSIVSSFVGIAPADNPRIVVSVILYDPHSSIWGGEVAAPVFKDVATFALQTLRVPPSQGSPTPYPTTWE